MTGLMSGRSGRILVVDDDPSIRRTLELLLSRAGYQVTQARDGTEAARLWRDFL
jgi:CheY-like chemotaxis protein